MKKSTSAVVILAGGHSQRMTYPKAWIKFMGEITFLEQLVYLYSQSGIENIVVVLNEEFSGGKWRKNLIEVRKKAKVVLNNEVDKGRSHSLRLGLNQLKASKIVFIQNVDSPYVKPETIKEIYENREEGFILQPSYQGKNGHPILISSNVVNTILKEKDESKTLREILSSYEKKKIEVKDKYVLTNLNNKDDVQAIKNEFV